MLNFVQSQKDYKTEVYRADFGNGVTAIVAMHYHTTRKYWHVNYYWGYGEHYRSEIIDGKSYVESRKEARKYAEQYMKNASWNDLNKMDAFNRDNILKSITPKSPNFISF